MKQIASQIKQILSGSASILLVAHTKPDADAIGSMLALYGVLAHQMGLKVAMALDGEIPQNLAYLPYFFRITDGFRPERFDTVVILDCSGWSRTGFFETDELNIDWPNNLIVIDHHVTKGSTPGVMLMDTEASSTSEVIWKLLKEWQMPISPDVATCLLSGISADTGSFQHTNTSRATFEAASEMMLAGAHLNKIVSGIYLGKSAARLKLWGRVLSRMKYDAKRQTATSIVTQQDLVECGAASTDIEGLVNLMSTVPEAKFVLLMTETKDGKLKGSFRTEQDDVDVRKLAEFLGGGGHVKAAGFTVPGRLEMGVDSWRIV